MVKYRTVFNEIKACEVLRETGNFVYIKRSNGKERREAKFTCWQSWHDTWEEAKAHLIAEQVKKVDALREQLNREFHKISELEALQPPEDGGGHDEK